jgi:hypothetical protein
MKYLESLLPLIISSFALCGLSLYNASIDSPVRFSRKNADSICKVASSTPTSLSLDYKYQSLMPIEEEIEEPVIKNKLKCEDCTEEGVTVDERCRDTTQDCSFIPWARNWFD